MAIAVILKSAEVKLMETLGSIQNPMGWYAIDFNLSQLLEQYKSEYQVKIAINLIHDLLKDYDGGIMLMNDHNILVLCRQLDKTLQNKLIFQLRYLYMDDPLAYTEGGEENPDFCTVYDLSRSWQEFWDISSRRMAMSVRKSTVPTRTTKKEPSVTATLPAKSSEAGEGLLSASRLATIEQDLRHADLTRVLRRQAVCAAMPNGAIRRVFDELYIHIAHLRQMLKSEVDFFSNRWLFKYITQLLDERMIFLIRQHPGRYLEQPVSLNLNVETLLSSTFTELDAVIKPAMKVAIVIEVPVMDVFADLSGFLLAKKEVQRLGYRVCLDGLTVDSFMDIDREKLGLDLVKVQWNAEGTGDINTKQNRDLASAVQDAGSNRVILCRCDNRQAIDYGQALGISLFQGRYLDSLLDPQAKIEN